VLLWSRLVIVLKGKDAGAGGREGLWVGRYTDARLRSDGSSPLYIASNSGHVSCVEALIRGKADVLHCDK
jgi:hypothetical protein